ncbi:hypothetical protein CR492_03755 [Methylocella silvestris]|uniref:Uncharacterized protein n=1 Tax=Methylocella silvestris TaxID=199596 RepID=A0A2J7TKB8_METSI|nr:hypothetical protein CR492_03755 [Methylocella silvestris]
MVGKRSRAPKSAGKQALGKKGVFLAQLCALRHASRNSALKNVTTKKLKCFGFEADELDDGRRPRRTCRRLRLHAAIKLSNCCAWLRRRPARMMGPAVSKEQNIAAHDGKSLNG